MDFEKAFQSVKKKFEKADAKNVADFALQITMSDEDCGGTLYVAVKDGVLAVEPYDYRDNNAVLDIAKTDLLSLIGGKLSLARAIEKGATLKGDAAVIDLMRATVKAAAVKKAVPAKKAAVKKEVKKTAAKVAAKTAAAKTAAKAAVKTAAKTAAKTAVKAEAAKAAVKAEVKKAEAKAAPKAEAKKAEAKAAPKAEVKKPAAKKETK